MKIDDIKRYEHKNITIHLKNKYYYSGFIIKFLADSLIFKDKFNNTILISIDEITTIIELNGGEDGRY